MDQYARGATLASDQPSEISQDFRDEVYGRLAECVITALENPNPDVISLPDAEQSADYILPRLDAVQSRSELIIFLRQLSERWPIYHSVYIDYQKNELLDKVQIELDALKGGNP